MVSVNGYIDHSARSSYDEMVDPISIISLLGTAATLTKNILSYVSSVKAAPKELENLRSELANLHGIVEPLVVLAENEDGKGKFSEGSILYKSAAVRSYLVLC